MTLDFPRNQCDLLDWMRKRKNKEMLGNHVCWKGGERKGKSISYLSLFAIF